MKDLPSWFNPDEYSNFLMESVFLFETPNIPYWRQKNENRKKLYNFRAQKTRQEAILQQELARDLFRAKAKGIQQGLGEEFKLQIMEDFLSKLEEQNNPVKREKRKMRPEVDPADRDRDRKREERREKNKTPLSNVLIVRHKGTGKLEIIVKDDYEQKTHEVLKGKIKNIDKGSISKTDLIKISKKAEFINTKTSIKLIGKVEKEVEDTPEEKTSSKRQNSSAPNAQQEKGQETLPPPMPRVPLDGKEITDTNSTYPDWDHTSGQLSSGIAVGLNSLSNQEMPPDFADLLGKNRTLGDAINRAINQLLVSAPILQSMKFRPADPIMKTDKNWSKQFGIKQSTPAATIIGEGKKENVGISIKIGEQIRPAEKGEAGLIFSMSAMSLPPEDLEIFSLMLDDALNNIRTKFSTSLPNMSTGFMDGTVALNKIREREKNKQDFQYKKDIIKNEIKQLIESFLNQNTEFKTSFLFECLSGQTKFGGGDGSAKLMISMEKDGTNAEMIILDPYFATRVASSDAVQLNIKFVDTPSQENSFIQNVYQKLLPLNESAIEAIMDLEKIKTEVNNPLLLMQIFEIEIKDITYQTPVKYSDYFDEESDADNIIIINPGSKEEKQVLIPVVRNYNSAGKEENIIEKGADHILEEYCMINDYLACLITDGEITKEQATFYITKEFHLINEERNYRREYDNYHSKPEQIANRSKRVLARRKMKQNGKVKKGDGKDVHHKDGNPQNNSNENLTVMNKSKNRSMNEDHGAGFEGTPELVQKLVDETPYAQNPCPVSKSLPYAEKKYLKNKKRK